MVCALQETKIGQDIIPSGIGTIYTLPHAEAHHGLGFYVHPALTDRVCPIIQVSDRIAVLQIRTNPTNDPQARLTIINVYAPHSGLTARDPELNDELYGQLQDTYTKYKRTELIYICGDFNARLGTKQDPSEQFMGRHSKKSSARNANGHTLANFLKQNTLFATNTAFQHLSRHISTWHGIIQNTTYHNQIDYVICPHRQRSLTTNSRAHNGMDTTVSDHGIVITTIAINRFYRNAARTAQLKKDPILDVHQLHMDPIVKEHYLQTLQDTFTANPVPAHILPAAQWEIVKDNMITSANQTIPVKNNKHNRIHNAVNNDQYMTKTRARLQHIKRRLYRSARRHV